MKNIIRVSLIGILVATSANAIERNWNNFRFKLDAGGSAGIIKTKLFQPEFKENPVFLGDWDVRGEIDYDITQEQRIGIIYALDAVAIDEDKWMHELFALWQVKNLGRIEVGFTSSVGHKLGIGLPDVGGMRVNEEPLFYKKISPKGPVIADTMLSTGHNHEALRVNVVSASQDGIQYGIGVAGLSDEYKFSGDGAIKIRKSSGKTKYALSIGAAYMHDLKEHHADIFSRGVTADWRAQASVGFNLQYNSIVWATSVRGIYDYNPVGVVSDGIAASTGISYDLLSYSVSLSYILSDAGIWHSDADKYIDHTVIGSFRYKYSENVDLWLSGGVSSESPFLSAAMRIHF